jgi:hypothetical protein
VGQAGDDILIAGGTAYDADLTAWCAMLHEWARPDASYCQRVAHLTSGGGWNGDLVLTARTVFDDRAPDKLTGSCGRDWFLAALEKCGGDRITDRHCSETVTPLAPTLSPDGHHHGGCAPRVDRDGRCAADRDEPGADGACRIDWDASYCAGGKDRGQAPLRKQSCEGRGLPEWDVWLSYL